MRVWIAMLLGVFTIGSLVGCADLALREVDIQGNVLLQGQSTGNYGGTTVTLEGTTSTTDSAGNYALSGYVGGADDYSLTFSHPGYTPRMVTGRFAYDSIRSLVTR